MEYIVMESEFPSVGLTQDNSYSIAFFNNLSAMILWGLHVLFQFQLPNVKNLLIKTNS